MDEREAAEFSGAPVEALAPMRIIEDGAVRLCAEVLMKYRHSFARVLYMLPKSGEDFFADYILYTNEKDRHIRLHMPTSFASFAAQTAYGQYRLSADGKEQPAQRWFAGEGGGFGLAVVNRGTYGVSVKDSLMRQSLVRTSAYAALTLGSRPLVPSDRFMPRLDQGERRFSFMFCGGDKKSLCDRLDDVSLAYNEAPSVLSFFPNGSGKIVEGGITVEGARMDAFKKAESGDGYVLRLFNPKNGPAAARVEYKAQNIDAKVDLGAFEIATYSVKPGKFFQIPMLEKEY
jgi:alpha-mannosidase